VVRLFLWQDLIMSSELILSVCTFQVGVVYQYDALLESMARQDTEKSRVRLTEEDISCYAVGPAPSATAAMLLTQEATARWRAAGVIPETTAFWISVSGERLFSGVFYHAIGAAGIRTPVIHVGRVREQQLLFLGAIQGATGRLILPEATTRLDQPAIREVFRRLHRLQEKEEPPSFFLPEQIFL
jgi:hypothetical protein